MRPALLVDVDVDIYEAGERENARARAHRAENARAAPPSLSLSLRRRPLSGASAHEATVEALEFLVVERLLVAGSFVYYDDWMRPGEGERKAHDELTRRYAIVWREFRPPFVFQVVSLVVP